nr:serine/threonine-protein kinase AFC2 isoform X3 [Tanacetum cinerariifolium]
EDSEDDEEVCVVTSMSRGSRSGEGTSKGLPKKPRHKGPMDMFFARKPEDVLTDVSNRLGKERRATRSISLMQTMQCIGLAISRHAERYARKGRLDWPEGVASRESIKAVLKLPRLQVTID